jgi:hypothetical protein
MNFKSQICTNKEQSKRLLVLGLKKETADMKLIPYTSEAISIDYNDGNFLEDDLYPAWSLHRLMEIGNITGVGFPEIDNIYEVCIRIVASKIKFKLIDPEYINN